MVYFALFYRYLNVPHLYYSNAKISPGLFRELALEQGDTIIFIMKLVYHPSIFRALFNSKHIFKSI